MADPSQIQVSDEVDDLLGDLAERDEKSLQALLGRLQFLLVEGEGRLAPPNVIKLEGPLRAVVFYVPHDSPTAVARCISFYRTRSQEDLPTILLLTEFRLHANGGVPDIERLRARRVKGRAEREGHRVDNLPPESEHTMTKTLQDVLDRQKTPAQESEPYLEAIQALRYGQAIRACREAAGMTQAALAEATGTSQPAVARWESGRSVPRLDTLRAVAAVTQSSLTVRIDPLTRQGEYVLVAPTAAGDPLHDGAPIAEREVGDRDEILAQLGKLAEEVQRYAKSSLRLKSESARADAWSTGVSMMNSLNELIIRNERDVIRAATLKPSSAPSARRSKGSSASA